MNLSTASVTFVLSLAFSPLAVNGNYCNWNQCTNNEAQGGDWCNDSQTRCETGCGGEWCFDGGPAPTPSPPTNGYCNWNQCTNNEVQGGDWCNANQNRCESGCGGQWCTGGGPGPTPSPPTASPPTGGPVVGTATTTRYWDCSGGACGCAFVPGGFPNPGGEVHCHSNALFAAPAGNPHGALYYGTAAVSQALGGGNWMAEACGKCWKVTGTGINGVTSTLVLRGANYCPPGNALCSGNNPHFDIAAPGFDVLQFSLANTCATREADEIEGFTACEAWMIGSQDPSANCDCSKFNDPVLRSGCQNFFSLQWDNPTVEYEEVSCPPDLSGDHCGYPYPDEQNMPDSCAGPSF